MEEDELFEALASDEGIQKAVQEHEAACQLQPKECPVCRFFNIVHELRHLSEAFDPEKILELAMPNQAEFLGDSLVIMQFFIEANRFFLDDLVEWDDNEDIDEEDEDDD